MDEKIKAYFNIENVRYDGFIGDGVYMIDHFIQALKRAKRDNCDLIIVSSNREYGADIYFVNSQEEYNMRTSRPREEVKITYFQRKIT